MRVMPAGRSAFVDPRFKEIFYDMMNALTERDLAAALETVDVITDLPSREKQKSFLKFASEGLRNVFLCQQNLLSVTSFPPEDEDFYRRIAAKCKRTFARNALAVMDRSLLLLERNVSQKILFTDAVCKLYRII